MKKQRGFTLVELSIVLVILGLLVGGVLTGQSLIHAAELRSISTQEQRYVAAVQTFRDKYFALPGDMTNAQTYWGVQDPTGTTCFSSASTTTATCNGNGDGKIEYVTSTSNENFRFWQHLANAGLIEGKYDGIGHNTSGNQGATTANSPSGRISNSLFYVNNFGTLSGNWILFDGQYDNTLLFGGMQANNYPFLSILNPPDIYNIDVKMDDGRPATGRVVVVAGTLAGSFPLCTDAPTQNAGSPDLAANYLLSTNVIGCSMAFRQAF